MFFADSKTSSIAEVEHETWIGHSIYLKTAQNEEEKNQNWPKVALMKGMFEDMTK